MPHEDIHTRHTTNPFATFAPNPHGVTFETQETGEKIILLLRAHLVTLVPRILVTIFLFFVPFIVPLLLMPLNVSIFEILNRGQVFLLTVFWYLFVFGVGFYGFIHWYFNVYLVTNERVVDIDFNGLLNKQIAYAKLTQIEDVTHKTIGFFGTFFHYGNIYVQTAGTAREFEFHAVARPDDVAKEIVEQMRKEEGEKPGEIA